MERSRDVDRLLAFSDAVASIAATLLVLPLVDLAAHLDPQNPGAVLSDHTGDLLAFGLSFVVIYRFWLGHHAIYEPVVRYSRALAWLNCLWLLSIVFLPFPTQLVGSGDTRQALTNGLYVGTLLVTTVANTLIQWVINASPELRPPGVPPRSIAPALITMTAMAAAFGITVAVPRLGVWPLLLLVPAGSVAARLDRPSGQ